MAPAKRPSRDADAVLESPDAAARGAGAGAGVGGCLTPLDSANAKIDMTAPLVFQIPKLNKVEYLAWVHEPFNFDGTERVNGMRDARLFEWDICEPLTRTSWWLVPLVWLPVAAFAWHFYLLNPAFSAPVAAGYAVLGLLIWSLLEYSFHRWIFHLDDALPDVAPALLLHFLLHGIHHKVPMDRYRLVMPPVLFAALCGSVYVPITPLALALFGFQGFHAIFGSAVVGYVLYDMMHFSQHHVSFRKGSWLWDMKRYHMKHHYSGMQNVGYGITSKLWDYIFGTVLDMEAAKRAAQDASVTIAKAD